MKQYYILIKEKYHLPDKIFVKVKRMKKGGFYAILPEYSGCVTLGKDFLDLVRNVSDAVLTYFQVPREDAKKIGVLYLPQIKKQTEKEKSEDYSKYFPQIFITSPSLFMYA